MSGVKELALMLWRLQLIDWTPPRNYIETFRNLSEDSTENMDLQDYMIGASYTTTTCSLQATHPLHLGFMVYLRYTKLTAPCAP